MTVQDKIGDAYFQFVEQINKRSVRYVHTRKNLEVLGKYIEKNLGEEEMASSDNWLRSWVDLSGAGLLEEPPTPEQIAADKAEREAARIKRLNEKDRAPGEQRHKTDAQIAKEAEESVRRVKENEFWLAFWPRHREYMNQSNATIMDQWLQDNGRKVSVDSLEIAFNATKSKLTNLVSKEESTVFTTYHALGDVSIPFTRPHLLAWMKTQKSEHIIGVKKQYPHLAKRIDAVIVGQEDPMTKPAPPAEGIKING